MEYKLGYKIFCLVVFLLFNTAVKAEDNYQEGEVISESWVKICEAKRMKLSEESSLFIGFDSPVYFEGKGIDFFMVNVALSE